MPSCAVEVASERAKVEALSRALKEVEAERDSLREENARLREGVRVGGGEPLPSDFCETLARLSGIYTTPLAALTEKGATQLRQDIATVTLAVRLSLVPLVWKVRAEQAEARVAALRERVRLLEEAGHALLAYWDRVGYATDPAYPGGRLRALLAPASEPAKPRIGHRFVPCDSVNPENCAATSMNGLCHHVLEDEYCARPASEHEGEPAPGKEAGE